ncbi:zinc finger HIT domain-containing protein 3 [Glossina fuscipes fuscipes]
MQICIVCREPTDKYKCRKCLERYCSLSCYKKHINSTECQACETPSCEPLTGDQNEDNEPTIYTPFSTEDTVAPEKLQQLAHSEGLKNLLYNPHLRNFLKAIDVAPNAWKAMQAAMQEPLFIEFADECLKIVEPSSEDEKFISAT